MNTIKLERPEQVEALIEAALKDVSVLEEATIEISPSLRRMNLHLEGDYDATITPTVMRSLLAIQDSLYDIYSLEKYGHRRRLSQDERESVELVAAVKPGTTSIDVLLDKAVEVLSHMSGDQVLVGIGILSGAYLIGVLGTKAFDYFQKVTETKQRAAETTGYQQLVASSVTAVLEGQKEFLKTIAKEPFQSLKINGTTVDRDGLKALVKTPRQKKEESDEVYRGLFRITRIYIEEDGTFIDAIHIESKTTIPYINILKDYIPAGDYQWLKDAVRDGKGQPVMMTVVAHEKAEKIEHAYLQSFDKQELESEN